MSPQTDPNPFQDGALVVKLGDEGYNEGHYDEPLSAEEAWQTFTDVHGWTAKWKRTSEYDRVYMGFLPKLPQAGRYAVEVFIPDNYADAQSVRYFVVYYENDERKEKKVAVDQSLYFNQWVSLGYFDLDPNMGERDAGRVNFTDYSIESPPKRVSVTAVRWRPVSPDAVEVAPSPGGLDWPIGTPEERAAANQGWPGFWNDANPIGSSYSDSAGNVSYHTGADLNLNKPTHNLDKGKPIYAINSGLVTCARRLGDYWLNVVVIEHDPPPGGPKFFARYAHVQNMLVHEGDRVQKGQHICDVGTSGGDFGNYHLHFDISTTDILRATPGQWPRGDLALLQQNYTDPKAFILRYRGG